THCLWPFQPSSLSAFIFTVISTLRSKPNAPHPSPRLHRLHQLLRGRVVRMGVVVGGELLRRFFLNAGAGVEDAEEQVIAVALQLSRSSSGVRRSSCRYSGGWTRRAATVCETSDCHGSGRVVDVRTGVPRAGGLPCGSGARRKNWLRRRTMMTDAAAARAR